MTQHTRQIAFWQDGYFIADDNAADQAEILDSVNAFGGEHTLMDVSIEEGHEAIQHLVNEAITMMDMKRCSSSMKH